MWTRAHAHTNTYAYAHTYTQICTRTHTQTETNTRILTNTHTHNHKHTHIITHAHAASKCPSSPSVFRERFNPSLIYIILAAMITFDTQSHDAHRPLQYEHQSAQKNMFGALVLRRQTYSFLFIPLFPCFCFFIC